jgi:three-Cys-motif partner protein
MAEQVFGGRWTAEKLVRLRGYLEAYTQIFKNRHWATTVYVDAFAGTGEILSKSLDVGKSVVDTDEQEFEGFLIGSAQVALMVNEPFDQYWFIEKDSKKAADLLELKSDFPDRADRIMVVQAEANSYLSGWIGRTNWESTRAVVFLDPYGMQVEWKLLEAIAITRAIDLWLLVPIGLGANRMMTQSDLPKLEWQNRLTAFFGNDDWKERFYRAPQQTTLFGDGPSHEKAANFDELASYFVERLRDIFGDEGVAPNPLTLRNSRNSPMYLLCFASANKTGVKIADWLLTNKPKT